MIRHLARARAGRIVPHLPCGARASELGRAASALAERIILRSSDVPSVADHFDGRSRRRTTSFTNGASSARPGRPTGCRAAPQPLQARRRRLFARQQASERHGDIVAERDKSAAAVLRGALARHVQALSLGRLPRRRHLAVRSRPQPGRPRALVVIGKVAGGGGLPDDTPRGCP